MKVLILSHFNPYQGPVLFLKAPKSFKGKNLQKLVSLMDLQQDQLFMHEFNEFKAVNLPFEIESLHSRGKVESLMVSIVLIDEEPKLKVLKDFLDHFVNALKKIPQIERAFLPNNDRDDAVFLKLKNFFHGFYESLPKETVFTRERSANIFVFGLDNAGKTTIINRLKKNLFTNPIPTTNINIVRLLFENLSLTVYDAAGQKIYRKLWEAHLKNQDGLVFILDVTDKKRYAEAASELHRISNMPELKDIPLLILFNKVDLKNVKKMILSRQMKLKKLKNKTRPLKFFKTSAKNNVGIDEAFNWLASQLLQNLLFQP